MNPNGYCRCDPECYPDIPCAWCLYKMLDRDQALGKEGMSTKGPCHPQLTDADRKALTGGDE
jgi:hypothetical protein